MSGPLSGFKIVDLTTMISGPLATMILADQGANVIKVETPNGGDHTRQVATRRNGFSASFLNNNRNKRSIALDLKAPGGIDTVKRLAADADVLIQNFRPGVITRLGLGYETMTEINPGLVYTSIAGFGFDGPYANKPVFDPLIQALSGLTTVQAGSDAERPRLVRTILPDKLTAFAAAQATCAALLAKSRSGTGQHVRVSMIDAVLSFLWSSDMGGHTFIGDELEVEAAQSFIDLIYETADGYISVAVMRRKEWVGLSRALERPDWIDDPRFATSEGLDTHKNDRLDLTQSVLRSRTTDDWIARLEAEDVPCAPVLTRRNAIRHPQILANDILRQVDHPVAGAVAPKPARRRSSRARQPIPSTRAPALGQHSREILEEAGYTASEIDRLVADGTAHGPGLTAAEEQPA